MTGAKDIPTTVSEAVNKLLSNLSLETKRQIQNTSEDGLINFHFGLGAGIRNEFGLWEKDSKLLSDVRLGFCLLGKCKFLIFDNIVPA